MTRLLLSVGALLLLEVTAAAQQVSPNGISISSFDPDDAVAPTTSIEGIGWKVGESTVLHPVVGLETGVVSNVFYASTDPQAAGILRLIAQIGTGTPSGARMVPSEEESTGESLGYFNYRANARASWDQMVALGTANRNSSSAVSGAGGLGLGTGL